MLLKCLLNLGFRHFASQYAINSVFFISTYLLLHFFLPLAFLAFPFTAYFIYLSVTVIYIFLILRFSPSQLFATANPFPLYPSLSLSQFFSLKPLPNINHFSPLPYLPPYFLFPPSVPLPLPFTPLSILLSLYSFFLSYPSPVSNTTSLPLPYLNPLPIFPLSSFLIPHLPSPPPLPFPFPSFPPSPSP